MPRSNSALPPAVGIGGNSCRQCSFSMSVSGIGGSASSTVTLTGARRTGRSCRPTRGARRARQRRKAGVWSRPTAAARVMPCLRVLLPIPALAPKLEAQSLRFCQARPQGGAQKKGPRLVVLRLLRLWPLLLLTPYRRARAADYDKDVQRIYGEGCNGCCQARDQDPPAARR